MEGRTLHSPDCRCNCSAREWLVGRRVLLRWSDGVHCEGTVEEEIDDQDIFWVFDHSVGVRRIVFRSELESITLL